MGRRGLREGAESFRLRDKRNQSVDDWAQVMYGLIIEAVKYMIQENFGEEVLTQVLTFTDISEREISTHDIYAEHIVPNIFKALCEITNMTPDQVGILAGRYFVRFLIANGYGELMNVMGRRFADFLKGLDNIHEYFRFSYPKIRPPSFYCSQENENGVVLHYRSRRKGYIAYVMGQLIELARTFYNLELEAEVVKMTEKGRFTFVTINLKFDNSAVGADLKLRERVQNLNEFLPVDTISFLHMFPFYISFDKDLKIISCGEGLLNLMPAIVGLKMPDVFDLQRPCIKFTAEGCITHENCNFLLESLSPVRKGKKRPSNLQNALTIDTVDSEEIPGSPSEATLSYVVLRGPIVFLKNCETFLLLATCVVDTLDSMFRMGLYLNDYGDADCNREIIMASIQKNDHLKILLEEEKKRSEVLTEVTREIREAKRKARSLLMETMPPEIATTMLRTGKVDHCQAFECVSLAFVKVCDFADISNSISAPDVVNLLNQLFLSFDEIVDMHGCYRVDTVSESYLVSSGVPYPFNFDAEVIADLCLHLLSKMRTQETKVGEKVIKIKIGANSGPVVAGVVGNKTPKYCIFGETVSTAARLESCNKTSMTIQIAQPMKDRLEKQAPKAFKIKVKGKIHSKEKDKGDIHAFELVGKSGRPRYIKFPPEKRRMERVGSDYTDHDSTEDEDGGRSRQSRMSLTEDSRASSPTANNKAETLGTLNKSLIRGNTTNPTLDPLRPLEKPQVKNIDLEDVEKKLKEYEQEKKKLVKREEAPKEEEKKETKEEESKKEEVPEQETETNGTEEVSNFVEDDNEDFVPYVPPEGEGEEEVEEETEEMTDGVNGDMRKGHINPYKPLVSNESFTSLQLSTALPSPKTEPSKLLKKVKASESRSSLASNAHGSVGGRDSMASLRNTMTDISSNAGVGKVPEEVSLPTTESVKDSVSNNVSASDEDSPMPTYRDLTKEKYGAKKSYTKTKEREEKKRVLPVKRLDNEKDCKCEDIRKDPRLKTKVCSIM